MRLFAKFSVFAAIFAISLSACNSAEEKKSALGDSAIVESSVEQPELKSADGLPLLVDFSATWCQPCQMLKPEFQKAAKSMKGKVEFKTIDVDENQSLAAQFGIQGVPTLVLLSPEGKEISRKVGYMDSEEIEDLAKSAL